MSASDTRPKTALEIASAAILAGGASRRFGRDKALEPVDGGALVARAADAARAAFDDVFLVADDTEAYAFVGLPVHPDARPGLGPLGGLLTALEIARHPWTFLVACDMPFAEAHVMRAMFDLTGGAASDADAVVVHLEGRWHPLFALYHRRILETVRARADAGELALRGLVEAVRTHALDADAFAALGGRAATLANANTPDELTRLLAAVDEPDGAPEGRKT